MSESGDEERYRYIHEGSSVGSSTRDRKKQKEPDINDYIRRVPTKTSVSSSMGDEARFQKPKCFAEFVLHIASCVHPLWKQHLQFKKTGIPSIAAFCERADNLFECLVLIRQPAPADTFQLVRKPLSEVPSHRVFLQLNRCHPREQRYPLLSQWQKCVDRDGVLRPDYILKWFNQGLRRACTRILEHNSDVSDLCYSRNPDGTLTVTLERKQTNATGNDSKGDTQALTVIFVPCLVPPELPRNLSIASPLPNYRPHSAGRANFRNSIVADMESGQNVILLDPRLDCSKSGTPSKLHPSSKSWQINFANVEKRAYENVSSMNSEADFPLIMTVVDSIKAAHVVCLHPLSRTLLTHAVFWQHRKHADKLVTNEDWLLSILKFLRESFNKGSLPYFFFPRIDLLSDMEEGLMIFTGKELDRLIRDLISNPESLLMYAGCEKEYKHKLCEADDDGTGTCHSSSSDPSTDEKLKDNGDSILESKDKTQNEENKENPEELSPVASPRARRKQLHDDVSSQESRHSDKHKRTSTRESKYAAKGRQSNYFHTSKERHNSSERKEFKKSTYATQITSDTNTVSMQVEIKTLKHKHRASHASPHGAGKEERPKSGQPTNQNNAASDATNEDSKGKQSTQKRIQHRVMFADDTDKSKDPTDRCGSSCSFCKEFEVDTYI